MNWVNLLVAISNVFVIPFSSGTSFEIRTVMYLTALFSGIYHLSETKYGLQGFTPLNRYSASLIQIDRFFAIFSFMLVAVECYTKPTVITKRFLHVLILGILCLLISERDIAFRFITKRYVIPALFKPTKIDFCITHSLWHLCAFYSMGLVFRIHR